MVRRDLRSSRKRAGRAGVVDEMGKLQWRPYACTVVNESVMIRLKRDTSLGRSGYFVQCDQTDCQYVEKNELPCMLNVEMFVSEIREIEHRRRHPEDR
jgi:hypothetical protein